MKPLASLTSWLELSKALKDPQQNYRPLELGELYFYGHAAGIEPDYALAKEHLQAAASPEAQYLLGVMEIDGLSEPITDHRLAQAQAMARWELSASPRLDRPRPSHHAQSPEQFYAPLRNPPSSPEHRQQVAINRALGYRYAYGIGVERSCPRARDLLFTAALPLVQEYLQQHRLSTGRPRMLAEPPGQEDTQQQMLEYYGYSADAGDRQAMTVLGQYRYYRGEWEQAEALLVRIIDGDLPLDHADSTNVGHACGYLGQMRWEQGRPAEAYRLWMQGARRSSPMSMAGLGHLYWHGVQGNSGDAQSREDKGQGHGSQVDFSLLPDKDEALSWFIKAADTDYAEGHYGAAMVLSELHAIQHDERIQNHLLAAIRKLHVPALFEMARRHLASDLTCPMALFLLKTVHEHDVKAVEAMDGAVEDYHAGRVRMAFSKLLVHAHQGYSSAMINLATLIMERGGRKSGDLARRAAVWWSRAANLEDVRSRVKLADHFYLGEGLPRDPVAAAAHYHRSIGQRSTTSAFNLALMYMRGLGVARDLHWATHLLRVSEYYGRQDGFPEVWLPIALARTLLSCLWLLQSMERLNWASYARRLIITLLGLIGGLLAVVVVRRRLARPQVHPIQMQPLPPTPTATEEEEEEETEVEFEQAPMEAEFEPLETDPLLDEGTLHE